MFISIGAGRTCVPSTLVDPFRHWHTSIMDHWNRWHFKQASYVKITSMQEQQTGAHNNNTSHSFHMSRKQKLMIVNKQYTSLHRFLLVQKEEIRSRDTCEESFNHMMLDRPVHLRVHRGRYNANHRSLQKHIAPKTRQKRRKKNKKIIIINQLKWK